MTWLRAEAWLNAPAPAVGAELVASVTAFPNTAKQSGHGRSENREASLAALEWAGLKAEGRQ